MSVSSNILTVICNTSAHKIVES